MKSTMAVTALVSGAAAVPVVAFVNVAAGITLLALPVYLIFKAG